MEFIAATITVPVHAAELKPLAASCLSMGSPPSKALEAPVAGENKRGKGAMPFDLVRGALAIDSPFTPPKKMARSA